MYGDGYRNGNLQLGGKLERQRGSGRELDRRHNFEQWTLRGAQLRPEVEKLYRGNRHERLDVREGDHG